MNNNFDDDIPESSPLFTYGANPSNHTNSRMATSEQIFDFLMDNPPADPRRNQQQHGCDYQQGHYSSYSGSLSDTAGSASDDFDPELIRQQHLIQQQIAMEQIQQQNQQQQQQKQQQQHYYQQQKPASFVTVEQKPYGTTTRSLKKPPPPSSSADAIDEMLVKNSEVSSTSSRSIHTESTPIPAEPAEAIEDPVSKQQVQLAEQRVSSGQCPSCGQQLYKVSGKAPRWKKLFKFGGGSNNKNSASSDSEDHPKSSTTQDPLLRKKPLHIPGHVHRGQCVPCSKNTPNEEEEFEPNVFLQDEEEEFQEDEYLQNSILHPLMNTAAIPTIASNNHKKDAAAALATYTGPTDELGQRHGSSGTLTWSNGDVYKGHFVHGARQGPGTLTFASQQGEYVGDWFANQMHGHGTRRFANGDLYTGPYVQGQRHGTNGRFYFANGDLYVGDWLNDQMHGFGRYYYHHGQRFEGDFVQGQRHGKGKLQRLDGSLDIHRYRNNTRQGAGVRWSADRLHAWKLHGNGTSKTKIPIAQAVSCVYEIENALQDQTATAHTSDLPLQSQMGLTV